MEGDALHRCEAFGDVEGRTLVESTMVGMFNTTTAVVMLVIDDGDPRRSASFSPLLPLAPPLTSYLLPSSFPSHFAGSGGLSGRQRALTQACINHNLLCCVCAACFRRHSALPLALFSSRFPTVIVLWLRPLIAPPHGTRLSSLCLLLDPALLDALYVVKAQQKGAPRPQE